MPSLYRGSLEITRSVPLTIKQLLKNFKIYKNLLFTEKLERNKECGIDVTFFLVHPTPSIKFSIFKLFVLGM